MMLFEELVEVVKEVLLNNSNSDDMLRAGDHFIYRGIEYVCLEIFGSEVYGHRAVFAVTTEIIKTMKFSEKYEDGCNNWRKSKVREWLNGEFLAMYILKEDVLLQTSDLIADNGDDTYGTSEDLVTLLSCDQYRKYRKLIPKYDDWVWTVTPYSCNSGHACTVRNIYQSGELGNGYDATLSFGVTPACLFNLDNLNLRRQTYLIPKQESVSDDYEKEDDE